MLYQQHQMAPINMYLKTTGILYPMEHCRVSALTMMKAVKNCIEHVGVDIQESLRMASLYPQDPGIDDRTGLIRRGYEASFVVFDNDMNVIDVI
jgi:N-acetylglucosamine-6-phosphate deacetylase